MSGTTAGVGEATVRLVESCTAFHTTPYRYMLRRRMDLAHQLLCNTAMPIGAIGEASGYDDPFYFSRVFKRYFHRSPERFRAEQRGGP